MHHFCKKTYLVAVLLLLLINTNATYDYIFEHLSTANGLSNGNVSAMMKDSKGFMWFATWDGLNRYDGYSFKTFKPSNNTTNSTASNRVQWLKEDALGNIWIITNDLQTYRLNKLTEQFESIPNRTSDSIKVETSGIFTSSGGDVWLYTNNNGVYRVTASHNNFPEISHLHKNSHTPIHDNRIDFLTEDQQNNIWISANNYVICYSTANSQFTKQNLPQKTEQTLKNHQISTFHHSQNKTYFGTLNGMVLIFSNSSKTIQVLQLNSSSAITSITGNNKGQIFISSKTHGISIFNEVNNALEDVYAIKNVLKTYPDSKGMLWVETTEPGIAKINLTTGVIKQFSQTLNVPMDIKPTSQVGIMEDDNQTIWLTLKGGGFGYYNVETDRIDYFFNNPQDENSKISNFVNCFYKDASGVLWLSTYFRGIEKITSVKKKFNFTQPAPQANLSLDNEVRALLEDSHGYLWVATKKGELFILNSNLRQVKKIENLNGTKIGQIYAMLEDSNGFIYLGTRGNGLFIVERSAPLTFKSTHHLHNEQNTFSLSNNNIYSLLQDNLGNIWIGTFGGGINIFNHQNFINSNNELTNYPLQNAARVRHIAKDSANNIWIATTTGIVVAKCTKNRNEYKFQQLSILNNTLKGVGSNDVFTIFCDKKNNIWLSSLGGGLSLLKKYTDKEKIANFNSFTIDHGLSSNVIYSITDDEAGNIWLSTDNGISLFNPHEKTFRNFGRYDGITNATFSEGAIAKSDAGRISFGANNGIYSFTPSQIMFDEKSVNIELTAFHILGNEATPNPQASLKQAIAVTTQINLKHYQNVFSVSWAALDFGIRDNVKYAYMLEGFDDDWKLTEHNKAEYTKLPPGKYKLKIKITNPEFERLSPEKHLAINITPPLWKTKLAYFFYFLIIVLMFEITRRITKTILTLRHKVAVEKEITDIKINFFTNISHELRTPLTLILAPTKEIKASEKLTNKGLFYANLIEENALRLLRLVNQLLDFRKVESEKMELLLTNTNIVEFTKSIAENFNKAAKDKQIKLTFNSQAESIVTAIDKEKFDSIIYNLLSNAIKFTQEKGKITISIKQLNGKVFIEIKDNGLGVPKEQEALLFTVFASHAKSFNHLNAGTGIGLALSKEFVKLHGGTLSYQPTDGGGATFTVCINTTMANEDTVTHTYKEELTTNTLSIATNNATDNNLPKILVVEDNEELRTFIKMQLTSSYKVIEADNGELGFELALEHQPEIILSDIMMPKINGIQLLEKIKNSFETSHIPVVLLSAKSSVESKIEGLKYGADAYLTKPFNSTQLKLQLENLRQQRTLLRQKFSGISSSIQSEIFLSITDIDNDFLNKTRQIIEDNLTNSQLRIEDIYKNMGMGKSKFFDKIKGLTGMSPIDFVKEYRLSKAHDLLLTGRHNISEAAFMSGFSDAGYFSKCFKERFGETPSSMIKK